MRSQLVDHVPAHAHGGGEFPFDADGAPNPRCQWDTSVCAQSPTHYVAWGHASVNTYCVRHYVLVLAQLLELHLLFCPGTVHDHLRKYGPIPQLQ